MKLISCHIENFGKLHDYSMNFIGKTNILCAENGWGKSTLTAFIRAMFYGLEGKRKQSVRENEYKKYMPWQGGIFGGRLTFEVRGKEYIVTRTFGEQEDFELRDAKTNLVSSDYTENLGKEIFQVDRESFMRTVFIGQGDLEVKLTDDINAKIGNLTDNTNDINNYETAEAMLTKLINSLTPKRSTGKLSRRADEIAGLERQVVTEVSLKESVSQAQNMFQTESARYDSLKQQLKFAGEKQKQVLKWNALQAQKGEWSRLQETFTNRKKELEKVQAELHRETADIENREHAMERHQTMIHAWNEYNVRKNALSTKQATFAMTKASLEREQKERRRVSPLLIAGMILFFAGIAFTLISLLVGILIGIGGIALGLAGMAQSKRAQDKEPSPLAAEASRLEREIQEDRQFVGEACKKISNYLNEFGKTYEEEQVAASLSDIERALQRIREMTWRYERLEELYQEAKVQKEEFEACHDTKELDSVTPNQIYPSVDEMNANIMALTATLESSQNAMISYANMLEDLQQSLDELEEKKVLLEELRTLQESDKAKYHHAVQARKYLEKAKEAVTMKYVAPLLEHFKEYYGMITQDGAEGFHMDANTTVTVDEYGKQRNVDTLSAGYQDLIGLCLRIAFIDAMYEKEPPVIIMDDPFTNLDDDKVEMGMKFLEEIGKKYQILYLTCSKSRS